MFYCNCPMASLSRLLPVFHHVQPWQLSVPLGCHSRISVDNFMQTLRRDNPVFFPRSVSSRIHQCTASWGCADRCIEACLEEETPCDRHAAKKEVKQKE